MTWHLSNPDGTPINWSTFAEDFEEVTPPKTHDEIDAQLTEDILNQQAEIERLDKIVYQIFEYDLAQGETRLSDTYMEAVRDWVEAKKVLRAMLGEPEPVYSPLTAAELTLLRAEHCPF